MTTEQWQVLRPWFIANHKTLPKDVSAALDSLFDDHGNEINTDCVECGVPLGDRAEEDNYCEACALLWTPSE